MSFLKTLQNFLAPRDIFSRAGDVTYAQHLLTQSNTLDLEIDPLQNSVVAACVNAVARALPDAPLLLENRTPSGWKEVTDHECLRVLRAPNEDHSDADVWGLTAGYKATRGQAFWLLLPDKAGRVGELHVWNPERVTVLGDESHFISAYRLRTEAGGLLQIPKNQIVHFRHLPDFRNPRLGWSPLRTGRAQIVGDNIGATYHTSILHNAGVVSLLISLKEGAATGQVTPEQFQQVLTNIRRASRERSGGVEGINLPLEVHKLAYSPDEMNVDQLIAYYEARICAVMGVPQRVAGLGADPTYHNLSEALNDFWERRIVPDRNSDAATLNRQWLPLFGLDDGNWRFRFDFSGVPALQENQDALHARVRADWEKGLVDKGQARALLGYAGENESAFQGVFFGENPTDGTHTQEEEALKRVWFEADHPRNYHGEFDSGGGSPRPQHTRVHTPETPSAQAHLLGLLRANSSLSPENLKAYSESMSHVVSRIPAHLHSHLMRRVRKIEAFNGLQKMREYGMAHWNCHPLTLGAWHGKYGAILLDGEETNNVGRVLMSREGIYAHELTHALDSVHYLKTGRLISATPEWMEAFNAEKKGFEEISVYATENPKEGFAELGRMFYSTKNSANIIRSYGKSMPRCIEIWKREGLIP